jgi:ribonuclease E
MCEGHGAVRTTESAALVALRKLHNRVALGDVGALRVSLPTAVALYLLNQKRDELARLELRYDSRLHIELNDALMPHQIEMEVRERPRIERAAVPHGGVAEADRPPAAAANGNGAAAAPAGEGKKKRRRRGRRRGAGLRAAAAIGDALTALGGTTPSFGDESVAGAPADDLDRPRQGERDGDQDRAAHAQPVAAGEAASRGDLTAADARPVRSKRGRRGGRRRRGGRGAGMEAALPPSAVVPQDAAAPAAAHVPTVAPPSDAAAEPSAAPVAAAPEAAAAADSPSGRRSRRPPRRRSDAKRPRGAAPAAEDAVLAPDAAPKKRARAARPAARKKASASAGGSASTRRRTRPPAEP